MAMSTIKRERILFVVTAALAAGALVWGVVVEQLGETLFNATLV